ncbi:MAG TPA: hypothetical protein VIF57_22585 [Polyangia bacterium]
MRATAFVLGAVLVAIGCDNGPRRITAADIVPIAPGTATGSLFAGEYVITSGLVEGCNCRLGNCATIRVLIGTTITVAQTDGTLQLATATSTGVCTGAVDGDGTFHCNGALVQPGDVEYTVASGRIQSANGQPTYLTETQELTATVQDAAIDCDIRGTATAQYSGPAAAAFAASGLSARAIGFSPFGL